MHEMLKKFLEKKQRRKLTFKGNKLSFQGREVKRIQEYNAFCYLSGEEENEFEELKECISKFNLYCTFGEFDRFLNNIVLTGNCQRFIEAFKSFAEENPADNYLLSCRMFYVATMKGSPN